MKPNLDRCSVTDRHGEPCGQPAIVDLAVTICGQHAAQVYRYVEARKGSLSDDPLFEANSLLESYATREAKERRQSETRDYVVYYLQVGQHIKIGYTGRLKQRMKDYPAMRRLLATEPGAWDLEARRHQEFRDYRVDQGREWFLPGPGLLLHINQLRSKSGAAPIAYGKATT